MQTFFGTSLLLLLAAGRALADAACTEGACDAGDEDAQSLLQTAQRGKEQDSIDDCFENICTNKTMCSMIVCKPCPMCKGDSGPCNSALCTTKAECTKYPDLCGGCSICPSS